MNEIFHQPTAVERAEPNKPRRQRFPFVELDRNNDECEARTARN